MKKEIWKDIVGYEGLYQVSNLGRVRSKYDKYSRYGNKNNMQSKINDEYNILKPVDTGKGYLRVRLSKNKKISNKAVHRLVAQAFIPNERNKPFINHIDGNPSNNCVSNIEWCTPKENINHAITNNLIQHHKIKMFNKDGVLLKTFNSRKEVEIFLGRKIYTEQITRCCNGTIKTSYGYIWRYSDE